MTPQEKLEQLERDLREIEVERDAIHRQIEPLRERLIALHREAEPFHEQIGHLRLQMEPWDWARVIKDLGGDTPRSSMALYQACKKRLADQFDMWKEGYWSDTREMGVSLKLDYKSEESEQKTLLGIRTLTPLYTPHEDGYVWFGIFEHTLSAGAVHYLKVKPDLSGGRLEIGRWNKVDFDSVEAAVHYIRLNHWYDGGPEDDDD